MELKEIENVDFANLDIDKYVNWLRGEYELFRSVKNLPYIDSLHNIYQVNKFRAEMHYKTTRNKELPDNIKLAYNRKINHFKAESNRYEGVPLRLIHFESVKHERGKVPKKYGFFNAEELKQVEIDTSYFKLFLNAFETSLKNDFANEIIEKFKSSPLTKLDFYAQQSSMLKEDSFEFLERILHGDFIYNLDNLSNALNFSVEIERIWKIHYLEKEILSIKNPIKNREKVYSLNPNFDDFEEQIKIIHDKTKELFDATLEQWKNLFSNDIKPFDNPIELKQGISKADLRVFIDDLKYHGLIRTGSFIKVLVSVNAFSVKGKTLSNDDYKSANNGRNYPNTRNSNKVKEVFHALKLLDK